jgi:4'-phosphopantetheinyl transferase EntD
MTISLSHSAGIAAAAVGPSRIALEIDLERRKARDFIAIADAAFGSAEKAQVAAEGHSLTGASETPPSGCIEIVPHATLLSVNAARCSGAR